MAKKRKTECGETTTGAGHILRGPTWAIGCNNTRTRNSLWDPIHLIRIRSGSRSFKTKIWGKFTVKEKFNMLEMGFKSPKYCHQPMSCKTIMFILLFI
jgi:hypothetical protein